MPSRRVSSLLALTLAAVAAAVFTACSRSQSAPHVVTMDSPAPEISGAPVVGHLPVSLADAAGKVLVVNVWATWCGPCRQEQPDLVKVANAYRAKGVEFLGIDYQDDQAKAATWIDQFNVPYPSLFDPAGRTAAQLKYPFLPDTYVVDRSGIIRYAIFGRTTQQELSGAIDKVLAFPTASPSG